VGERWEADIRAAAERGQVYVGRSLSWLDFLALDWLTKEHALPLVRFTNDVGPRSSSPLRPRRASPRAREARRRRHLAELLHRAEVRLADARHADDEDVLAAMSLSSVSVIANALPLRAARV
jgi:hypothetical protein